MKKTTILPVSSLAMAVSATIGFASSVEAQHIACPQTLDVGRHVSCSSGSLRINPDGTVSPSGCLLTEAEPLPGVCYISTTAPITRDVTVTFPATFINLTNGMGQTVRLDRLRMQNRAGGPPSPNLLLDRTDVSNTVTIDIGGDLSFSDNQSVGNYSGSLAVSATLD